VAGAETTCDTEKEEMQISNRTMARGKRRDEVEARDQRKRNQATHTLEEPFRCFPVLGRCRGNSGEVVVSEEVEVGESVELMEEDESEVGERRERTRSMEKTTRRWVERKERRDHRVRYHWRDREGRGEGRDDGRITGRQGRKTHVLEDALQLNRGDPRGESVVLAHDTGLSEDESSKERSKAKTSAREREKEKRGGGGEVGDAGTDLNEILMDSREVGGIIDRPPVN